MITNFHFLEVILTLWNGLLINYLSIEIKPLNEHIFL